MSAQWRGDARPRQGEPARRELVPMGAAHLADVMAIELAAYAFPWTRGNFIDSLAAGYPARVLLDAAGEMLGYFVAMSGVDEMHLLNITVSPAQQGRGHARVLLDALLDLCAQHGAHKLWLEVRGSNSRARAMYEHMGFVQVGVRKGYYPAPFGRRENAIVMSLHLGALLDEAGHAME